MGLCAVPMRDCGYPVIRRCVVCLSWRTGHVVGELSFLVFHFHFPNIQSFLENKTITNLTSAIFLNLISYCNFSMHLIVHLKVHFTICTLRCISPFAPYCALSLRKMLHLVQDLQSTLPKAKNTYARSIAYSTRGCFP